MLRCQRRAHDDCNREIDQKNGSECSWNGPGNCSFGVDDFFAKGRDTRVTCEREKDEPGGLQNSIGVRVDRAQLFDRAWRRLHQGAGDHNDEGEAGGTKNDSGDKRCSRQATQIDRGDEHHRCCCDESSLRGPDVKASSQAHCCATCGFTDDKAPSSNMAPKW